MKKRGARINQSAATLPLGIKRTKYEFDARAAMLAIERGVCNEQHIVDLFVLADLCEHLNNGAEKHIQVHTDSVKKLAEAIHNKTCNGLAAASIIASSNILLDWFLLQNNKRTLDITLKQMHRLAA